MFSEGISKLINVENMDEGGIMSESWLIFTCDRVRMES